MVEIFDDLEALSHAAAALFVTEAKRAVEVSGRFTVVLAGGSTPRRTYELLAEPPLREQVEWASVHIYWGDERCVPPDDPHSNEHMARQALLDRVPIPSDHIHPFSCHSDAAKAATDYEDALREAFTGGTPRFDLIYLGLGEDGHTASLIPGDPALDEHERWTAAVESKDPGRVTLTYAVLNQGSIVAFLVSGANKGDALRQVLDDSNPTNSLPAARVRPVNGILRYLVDTSAASKLAERK
ncbi:MAG: 6-phosphogluconolactonase [Chloroflexi bacterium RBG_19FT_COMBO_62_14]|nr:MAG: 6-phosphogluconolactonase [Chloroflexi bacterium RBG_19FT_COMBO_62_14]